MSITDELREYALGWDEGNRVRRDLTAIADRIDADHEAMLVDARKTVYQGYIELPKDADGVPIHVGDTVYGEDGRAWHVKGISLGRWAKRVKGHVVHAMGDSGQWRDLMPEWLTHERPDSWGRIADELKRYANDSYSEDEIDAMLAGTLIDFADRIRKLAKKEGERS